MATKRAQRDAAQVRHFIEQLSLILAQMGFPPMPARVWAAAMSADEDTLTPGDLAERLDVSPAAISGAVRYLVQVGMMERVPVPGSRRQHYRVPIGDWYEVFVQRESLMKTFSSVTADGIAILGPSTPAGRRIAEVRDFFDFLASELGQLLDRWHAQRPK